MYVMFQGIFIFELNCFSEATLVKKHKVFSYNCSQVFWDFKIYTYIYIYGYVTYTHYILGYLSV